MAWTFPFQKPFGDRLKHALRWNFALKLAVSMDRENYCNRTMMMSDFFTIIPSIDSV